MIGIGSVRVNQSKTITIPANRGYILCVANALGIIIVGGYFYSTNNHFHNNIVNNMKNAVPTISYSGSGVITLKAASTGSIDYRCFLI